MSFLHSLVPFRALSFPPTRLLSTIYPFGLSASRVRIEQIELFAVDGPFGLLLLARRTYADARVNENSVTSSR